MPSLGERLQKAWNAFRNRDPTSGPRQTTYYSYSSSFRPDRRRPKIGNERSIIAPILNRISVDAAAIDVRHIKLDDFDRYKEDVKDELNNLLTMEANLDQSAREFKQDVYASLLEEGYVAICPIIADINWATLTVNAIKTARVGKIIGWHPFDIDVELYNDVTGQKEQVSFPKQICVIIQNPFWDIMNAPNSLMQRLRRKLAILDQLDEKTASGKLDMIIQLPYSTRHETQKERARERTKDLEEQLTGSRYGIGYIDASEKVIQLGRPLENNLQAQIDTLTKQLHDEIGVSPEILNNTANEQTRINYISQIVEPIVTTFTDGVTRKWLTPTARTKGHRVASFYNAFRVVPPTEVAKLGDTLIRNQILTANEMRGVLGFKPSDQEGADMLMNPNMPIDAQMDPTGSGGEIPPEELPEDQPLPEEAESSFDRLQSLTDGSNAETEELPPDNPLQRLRRFSQGV